MFPLKGAFRRTGREFAAVIADEYGQRVVAVGPVRNGGQHPADRGVHLRNHGGETAAIDIGDVRIGLHGLLRRLQRGVRGGERQVHEVRSIAFVTLDQFDGIVPEQVSDVTFFVKRFAVALPVRNAIERVRVVVDFAAVGAVEVVVTHG